MGEVSAVDQKEMLDTENQQRTEPLQGAPNSNQREACLHSLPSTASSLSQNPREMLRESSWQVRG